MPSMLYSVRGAIVSRPGPVRVTEPVGIDASQDVVELAPLRLRVAEQIAFGTPYRCGEHTVIVGALGTHERMIVDGEAFDLKPAVSASSARFESLDDPATNFWSKGDRATVAVRGETLPECRVITGPALPFVARGQEPGWRIEISDEEIHLLGDYGATELRFPRPEPTVAVAEVTYHAATPDHQLSVFSQQETRFLSLLAEVHRFDLPTMDLLVLRTSGGETITARRSR